MVNLPHRRKAFRTVPTSGGGGATDPYYSNVSLLLHMNGTNGSTVFTDNSLNAFSITPSGNVTISTTQSKFGGAAGLFDGNGDYLTATANSAFNFSTSNFTIEWWWYYNNTNNYQYFFDIGANGTSVRLQNGSLMVVYVNGAAFSTSITALTTGTWYHMALVRSGNNFNFYIGGSSVYNFTSTQPAGNSTSNLRIGEYGGGTGFGINGYMDDFRITKGVARYTTNFTPPTAEFPNQ